MACNKLFLNTKYAFSQHHNLRYHSHTAFKCIIKQAIPFKTAEHVTCRRFSTILYSRHSWHKKRNVNTVSSYVNSALFMSTNESSDLYHVVVTNPSQTSANAADLSTKITDVASTGTVSGSNSLSFATELPTSAATNFTDIAVTMSDELQTAAQFVEPSLASLDLAHWSPPGVIQMFLEYLHISWQMPWWAAIGASVLAARIILLPVLVKTQKNAISMGNHMPQLQFLQAKFGDARKTGNSLEASRYASEIMAFMKEHNLSPIKNAMFPLIQAPVFVSFFFALRSMAKAPVESMKTGGIFWATDLTIPDPYYIMPVIACGTLYIVLKIGAESGVRMENLKLAKYFMQALPVIALVFCINFPSAVVYYWVTTNFCTLAIVSLMRIKPVRKFLKMPTRNPVDPKFAMVNKGFIGGVKEAYEDQKILGSIEERRRIDEMRFRKAGTGPIPRTYSYDPTKPRPVNIAEKARNLQNAVSAKQRDT